MTPGKWQQMETAPRPVAHARWVRASHWIVTLSVAALAFTGLEILMVHPRLYWGEVGNDLTPALLELPISRNHQHGGWTAPAAFFEGDTSPVSSSRTFEIFNQNGWGRSLHFLAGWALVVTGLFYLVIGVLGGHVGRHLVPPTAQRTLAHARSEIFDHLRLRIAPAAGGPDYGLLQRLAYLAVVFVMLPLTAVTGLTMSPALTAAFPILLTTFGGQQSARTLHFAAFLGLMLFVGVHVAMVVLSGFRRQLRAMTIGGTP